MPSLTDLSTQWDELDLELERSGGEWTESVAALWGSLMGEEADKVDGYALILADLKLKAEHAGVRHTEAMTRLWETPEGELALHLEAVGSKTYVRIAWLLARMEEYMVARNLDVVKGHIYRFQFENHSKAPVEVTIAADQLPPRFQRVTIEANKEALRAALESGATVEGVTLGERGRSLRIR